MSKHHTILKNLLAVTRCRSQSTAMRGWKVANKVSLSDHDEPAACELCGTRFRTGAVVVRPVPKAKRSVTLTIGGDCLVTLLEHHFSERREIVKRRAVVKKHIVKRYGGLVDAGSWIIWVHENASGDLIDAAVQLKHIGAVRSTAELKRLVAFHDSKRRYPAEAVLPVTPVLRACGVRVPVSITLNQLARVRAIVNGIFAIV